MKRLLLYVRRYSAWYGFGMLCTLVASACGMTVAYLSGAAIKSIQFHHAMTFGTLARLGLPAQETLGRIVLMLCITALIGGTARWLSRFTIFNTGRDIEYDLRNDLFVHLTHLGPVFYDRHKIGDLMSRLVNDLTAVRMMVGMGVVTFADAPATTFFALSFMLAVSVRLTIAVIAPYILLMIGIKRLSRSLMVRNLRVQQGLGGIESKVQESLAGIHVVKAYALEDHEAALFRKSNDDYNDLGLALARLRGAMFPMIRGTSAFAVMVVLIYGGSLVRRGMLADRRPGCVHGIPRAPRVAGHLARMDDLDLSARESGDGTPERSILGAAAAGRARRRWRAARSARRDPVGSRFVQLFSARQNRGRGRGIQRLQRPTAIITTTR